jgi:beta-glucosidase
VTGETYYKRKLFVLWTFSRFGTYSVDRAINAGLDLEMPGVNKRRTFEQVETCITEKKVAVSTVKERAKKVLELVQKCAKEGPEVLGGDYLPCLVLNS